MLSPLDPRAVLPVDPCGTIVRVVSIVSTPFSGLLIIRSRVAWVNPFASLNILIFCLDLLVMTCWPEPSSLDTPFDHKTSLYCPFSPIRLPSIFISFLRLTLVPSLKPVPNHESGSFASLRFWLIEFMYSYTFFLN